MRAERALDQGAARSVAIQDDPGSHEIPADHGPASHLTGQGHGEPGLVKPGAGVVGRRRQGGEGTHAIGLLFGAPRHLRNAGHIAVRGQPSVECTSYIYTVYHMVAGRPTRIAHTTGSDRAITVFAPDRGAAITLAMPVSSASLRKAKPLAVPGVLPTRTWLPGRPRARPHTRARSRPLPGARLEERPAWPGRESPGVIGGPSRPLPRALSSSPPRLRRGVTSARGS